MAHGVRLLKVQEGATGGVGVQVCPPGCVVTT